jgi:hypothetical protein
VLRATGEAQEVAIQHRATDKVTVAPRTQPQLRKMEDMALPMGLMEAQIVIR